MRLPAGRSALLLPVIPARKRLAFALDYPDLKRARQGAELVRESAGVLKVGLELFVQAGPAALSLGPEFGCDLFLDLKLSDIPETVERAVARAASHGVSYLTVHAGGGRKMLEAAVRRAEREATGLTLLAVTVLTSLDGQDLAELGVTDAPATQAARLAELAWTAGIRGMVCSAAEVRALRDRYGTDAVLVTPGIRPVGSDPGDQKRVTTPALAIRAGASLLVVGRPIRDAADPRAAAKSVLSEMEAESRGRAEG